MASQKKEKSNQPNESDPNENQRNQLKEIQNLLFGEQLSQVEVKINAFRDEIEKRLVELEKTFQSSIDSQAAEFTDSLAEQADSLKQLHDLQLSDSESVEGAINKIHELVQANAVAHNKSEIEIKNSLKQEIENLKAIMEKKNKGMEDRLEQSSRLLTQSKTDRKELANLFQSLVKSLQE
ncbi:hypothetical protein QWZ13_13150 [Reinekea marina]|uniref:Uncharacterized protein n=1 Tax=Reinekea marina TaxID=1310421 RepID=A0ABV7WM92_9GAMM|nr:hypothetical protein [Reinekea marina]MDN3649860.1 hypothetical protein [Reinekea marina]